MEAAGSATLEAGSLPYPLPAAREKAAAGAGGLEYHLHQQGLGHQPRLGPGCAGHDCSPCHSARTCATAARHRSHLVALTGSPQEMQVPGS